MNTEQEDAVMKQVEKLHIAAKDYLGHDGFSVAIGEEPGDIKIIISSVAPELAELDAESTQEIIDNAYIMVIPKYKTYEHAVHAMTLWINDFTKKLTGNPPDDEKLSWTKKADAAEACIKNEATIEQLKMLQDEADITGETIEELCSKIIAKKDLYQIVVAKISGLRRKTEETLQNATSPVDYEGILNAAIVQAEAMAAEIGINV